MSELFRAHRLLLCGSLVAALACGDDLDPCSKESASSSSLPVGCNGTGKPQVLSRAPLYSSDVTEEVATSRRAVVLDDAFAYWSDYSGRILRTPKAGGETAVLLAANDCSIAGLAVDDVGVYFGQNCEAPELRGQTSFAVRAKVSWLHKATGARHELAQQERAEVTQVAVLDATVYWNLASRGDAFAPDSSQLHGAPRDAAPSFDSVLMSSGAPFRPFVVGPHGIVWLDASGHAIRLSPLSGGSGEELAASPEAEALLVQGEAAYWTRRQILPTGAVERSLWQVPLDGGAATPAFDALVTEYVVADGTGFVGFGHNTATTQVQYRVYRWSPPAFEPVPLAAGFWRPHSIALDETHVFVIDGAASDGSLRLVRLERE